MDRIDILMSMFDPAGQGLEIGAGFNPIVPKAKGYRVETLDHATAEELREKWKFDPRVDVSRIEEVDYVSHGGSVAATVGKPHHYDYIIASHVIEHTVDLLGFLQDCERLLKPNGALVLAVPDKRRCFDVFGALSTTGSVLQAHIDGRQRHLPGTVYDYHAGYALRNGEIGWSAGSDAPLTMQFDLEIARASFERARTSDAYEDVHAWRFTPSSFRAIVSDVYDLGELKLREHAFVESPSLEFYVSLSVNGSGCPLDRLTLAKLTLVEQYEVLAGDFASQPTAEAAGVEERMRRLEALCLHSLAR